MGRQYDIPMFILIDCECFGVTEPLENTPFKKMHFQEIFIVHWRINPIRCGLFEVHIVTCAVVRCGPSSY